MTGPPIRPAPDIAPRIIRFRDAPHYLGMDRNRFNAEVRPFLTEIPIGTQGIGFDRLEPRGATIWSAIERALEASSSPAHQRHATCSETNSRPIYLYVPKEDSDHGTV